MLLMLQILLYGIATVLILLVVAITSFHFLIRLPTKKRIDEIYKICDNNRL